MNHTRQAFEAYYSWEFQEFENSRELMNQIFKWVDGEYEHKPTNRAWRLWQAAQANAQEPLDYVDAIGNFTNERPQENAIEREFVAVYTSHPNQDADIARLELLEDVIHQINNWRKAYPIEVFTEPDLKLCAELLKDGGQYLDCVSASNFRHVLDGVGKIIDEALADSETT